MGEAEEEWGPDLGSQGKALAAGVGAADGWEHKGQAPLTLCLQPRDPRGAHRPEKHRPPTLQTPATARPGQPVHPVTCVPSYRASQAPCARRGAGEAGAAGGPPGHLCCAGHPLPAAVPLGDNGSSCPLLWKIALGAWKPLRPRTDKSFLPSGTDGHWLPGTEVHKGQSLCFRLGPTLGCNACSRAPWGARQRLVSGRQLIPLRFPRCPVLFPLSPAPFCRELSLNKLHAQNPCLRPLFWETQPQTGHQTLVTHTCAHILAQLPLKLLSFASLSNTNAYLPCRFWGRSK